MAGSCRIDGSTSVDHSAGVDWNHKFSFCDPAETSAAEALLVERRAVAPGQNDIFYLGTSGIADTDLHIDPAV